MSTPVVWKQAHEEARYLASNHSDLALEYATSFRMKLHSFDVSCPTLAIHVGGTIHPGGDGA